MGSSFNVELGKYLEKKSNPAETRKSRTEKIIDLIPFANEINQIIKKVKEKEEFVDIKDTSNSVHVVENESLHKKILNAVGDIFLMKKRQDVEAPIKETRNMDTSQNKNKKSAKNQMRRTPPDKGVLEVEEEPDDLIDNTLDNLDRRSRKSNETFSDKELTNSLNKEEDNKDQEDCSPSYNKVVLYKPDLSKDMKHVLITTNNLIKKIPRPALEEFKKTEDFKKYIYILEKYGVAKRKDRSSETPEHDSEDGF